MLSYITKVDNFHIVSVNGRNVKVSQTLAGYDLYYPYDSTNLGDRIRITFSNKTLQVSCENQPVTAIIAATSIIQFIIAERSK